MSIEARSEVLWPDRDLAGCLFCTIVRDTRGASLEHAQRFNFFPASPLASVTWLLEGQCHWIERPEHMERPWEGPQLQTIAFSGAQLGSLVSWNPGRTLVVTVAFYPDAFSAMTGIDLTPLTDVLLDAEAVLPDSMLACCNTFLSDALSVGVEPALRTLQNQIREKWENVGSGRPAKQMRLQAWSDDLLKRATDAGDGRSDRQIARRIKTWTGVSQRDLNNLSRVEALYGTILKAGKDRATTWADIADEAGYADQAHMVRRLRQHTGFTPEELRTRVPKDEALWAYRLLEKFFDRPEVADKG
jgi:AraC-like DNA-binding protein